MRLIFAGTPELALPSLAALRAAGHEIELVLTREDAPVGRKLVLTPSPVAAAAEAAGLPLLKTNRIGPAELEHIRAANAELGVVVAYGALLDAETLAAPERGWINLHFSLLPRWRGAAPLQRALLHGDEELGVSVFQLERGMDTGPIWRQQALPAEPTATASELLAEFAEAGTAPLLESLSAIRAGETPRAQLGEPSAAPKFTAEEGRLRPEEPAAASLNRYRALSREPGAYLELAEGRLKVLQAAAAPGVTAPPPGELALDAGRVLWGCADGALELLRVQPAGRSAMAAADWWRGRR